MNKTILIGRWSQSPDLRYSKNGKEIMNCTLAVNDRYNREHTNFIPVTAFGKVALNTAEYTDKGSQVAVEGQINVSSYEKDGQRRYVTKVLADSITFLDSKKSKQQDNPLAEEGEPYDPNGLPF